MACISSLEYKTLAAIMYIYQLLKYIESSNSSLASLLYLHSLLVLKMRLKCDSFHRHYSALDI
jgi:hypothetical protein